MTPAAVGFSIRAIGYYAVRDFIPLYAVYALLFRDHGMSDAAISSLFVIWSVTSFLAEIPSGVWADLLSRRALLVVSSLLYACGFALWIVVPSYPGFAAGFVIWGLSGALMSGTFEALLYDELAALGITNRYAHVLGWANSAAMIATVAGTALAAPLLSLGGYAVVGWVSVAVALIQAAIARTLPSTPRVAKVTDESDTTSPGRFTRRYVLMLLDGLGHAARVAPVRHAVLIAALLMGFLAYDEYFPLIARENGVPTAQTPWFMAVIVVGQAIGTALAGRAATLTNRTLAWLLATAAVLLAAGAISGHPAGLIAITIGFGIATNVVIVSESRLQESIVSDARATVTSVAGFLSEVVAVLLFASVAVGSSWLTVSALVALLSVPLLVACRLLSRWLPARDRRPSAV